MFSLELAITHLQKLHKEELLFYQSYHRNPINILIHQITIPLEWLSWMFILKIIYFNWIVSFSIIAYYLILNSKKSYYVIFALITLGLITETIYSYIDTLHCLYLSIVLQGISWFVQVYIGHHYYEKNNPAMTAKLTFNSIILSYLMAWED